MADEVRRKFEELMNRRHCNTRRFGEVYVDMLTQRDWEVFEAGMRAGEIARWIPVEEKLPEIGVSVLVVTTPSRYVHDMKLVQREKLPEWRNYFDHNRPEKYYWLHLAGVTHWQPLPAAPEEKK